MARRWRYWKTPAAPANGMGLVSVGDTSTWANLGATYSPLPTNWSCLAVFCAPNSGGWTSTQLGPTPYLAGGFRYGLSTVNNEATWQVPLAAGTYTFSLVHTKDANRGIYSVSVDGASIATIDGYNSALLEGYNEVTGVVIPTSGLHDVRFLMATKNASSSAFFAGIGAFTFTRTGA